MTVGKEEFATVAGTTNDDGLLLRSAGAKTFVPGTLTDEKLDAALVRTPVVALRFSHAGRLPADTLKL